MTPLGAILGGAALLGIGVAIGARAAEKGLPRLVRYLARVERDAARAEREVRELSRDLEKAWIDLADLREQIPALWDRAFDAGHNTDAWRLITAAVERRQRQPDGGDN
jgi:hypothetical protein